MTEEKMLARLKKGDGKALEMLIDQYNAYVSSIIRMILGPKAPAEDVEELVADVFLSIWSHADTLKPGKVKPYIGAAARNTARSFLRKKQTLVMDLDKLPLPELENTPENRLLRREREQAVRDAVGQMPQPDREIFLRYYYYYQTSAQIAQAMGLSDANVRTRLTRGRNSLKQILCKEEVL